MSNKPIVPMFRGVSVEGGCVTGKYYTISILGRIFIHPNDESGGDASHLLKPETLQMSLDGKEWHTMERLEELIELGLQYEYAIESLAKEKEIEDKFEGGFSV